MSGWFTCAGIAVLMSLTSNQSCRGAAPAPARNGPNQLPYIDTSFENASPVSFQVDSNGTLQVYLEYDYERGASNRASGHIHCRLCAAPGSKVQLEFNNLENIWNGRPGSIARELKTIAVSEDGKRWRPVPLESLPGDRVRFSCTMTGPVLYLARVEPYRLSDLESLFTKLRKHPAVETVPIGRTVENRALEIVRVGNTNAAHRLFLRARAHPWESGGNWVLEGLLQQLLKEKKFRERYCTYILPMANKDGVAHGRTRFNLTGKDLNRDWGACADPALAPENYALEEWLEKMLRAGQTPELALDLHNDGFGQLHLARVLRTEKRDYLQRMARFEELLRKNTWFTEGRASSFAAASGPVPMTIADGWLTRFNIDAAVLELNCNRVAGLKDYATARHWEEFGEQLATAVYLYFER